MVVDTSALVAIERQEEDSQRFQDALYEAGGASLSAVNFVEFCMVVTGGKPNADMDALDAKLLALGVRVVDVSLEDAVFARNAFLMFGRGRHPAKLNFGDCFSYALAKRLREPLLFKGEDFSRTDAMKA